jgi:hypothetical protein
MQKPDASMDAEIYRNFTLFKLKRFDTDQQLEFRQTPGNPLDRRGLYRALKSVRFFTFNGNKYDMVILGYALAGATCEQLKHLSDEIINTRMMPWDAERLYGFTIPDDLDHVDLIEVVPGIDSLKTYGGKLHSKKLQDLPYPHDAWLDFIQIELTAAYCGNDLDLTRDLATKFKQQIDLRTAMSAQYGVDLRSKSDAQIAEAVLKEKISTLLGWRIGKPDLDMRSFQYKPPAWMSFRTPELQQIFAEVCNEVFYVKPNGKVEMPKVLKGRTVTIGKTTYKLGIGGLHSQEKATTHYARDGFLLIDRDVASYYPAIIIDTGLYPKHLGKHFLYVYRDLRDMRIKIKSDKARKSEADTLKIVLNGSFGKFGNIYSTLFSPDLLMQVTITGQLALLMLIESIEMGGISVVSGNTDGIVMRPHESQINYLNYCIQWWEKITGFVTEETQYLSLHSASVNSYIAIKKKFDKATNTWLNESDGVKTKGDFAEPEPVASSWPSPTHTVVTHAVCEFLEHGASIDAYIRNCRDVREFVLVQKVQGGATWNGQFVGKTCRWVYTTRPDAAPLVRCTPDPRTGNHGKVAKSEGCRPLMELPDTLPSDIDYQHYIQLAYETLYDIGYFRMG